MQSKMGSFIEAWVNVAIGFAINWTANMLILPLFGFNVTASQALGIGVFFTVISVARSYVIRRFFNARIVAASRRLEQMVAQRAP